MQDWEHITTMGEVVREEHSPVERYSTRAKGTRKRRRKQKQVSIDQSLCSEKQSGSKDGILWK